MAQEAFANRLSDIEVNSANISLVVEFIEKNNLAGVKRYIPQIVPLNARSVRNNFPLKDIALYLKRNENYFVAQEKLVAEKQVAQWDRCFQGIDNVRNAISVEELIHLLQSPKNIFCNDNISNYLLYQNFTKEAKEGGKMQCYQYLQGMDATFKKRVFHL
jgi:hypothetical protein